MSVQTEPARPSGAAAQRPPRRVPILMYHAVDEHIDPSEAAWSVRAADFDDQMRLLRDEGWSALTLGELCGFWERGEPPPPKCVVVTFDDGHACLHDVALPIMARHRIRSTLFAISGFLGRDSSYDDGFGTVPRPMLTAAQLRAMHVAGHEIGSHTHTHPDLRALPRAALVDELTRSREALQALVGAPVDTFAYPHGWFDRAVHDAVVGAGYRCAVSVMCGLNDASTPRHLLRRSNLGVHTTIDRFRQALHHGASPLGVARAQVREKAIDAMAALRRRDPLDHYTRPWQSLLS